MAVIVRAVKPDALRALLDVMVPLDMANSSRSPAQMRSALAAADEYYDARKKWLPWNRGEVSADADFHVLGMHVRGMRDMLAYSEVPRMSVGEQVSLAVPASVIHIYARAVTGEPNLVPESGKSTQLCYRYSWLDAAQVKKLVYDSRDQGTILPLRVPTLARLREERQRFAWSASDEEIETTILTWAPPWIRLAQQLEFAAMKGLAYVAYEEPYDAD